MGEEAEGEEEVEGAEEEQEEKDLPITIQNKNPRFSVGNCFHDLGKMCLLNQFKWYDRNRKT